VPVIGQLPDGWLQIAYALGSWSDFGPSQALFPASEGACRVDFAFFL